MTEERPSSEMSRHAPMTDPHFDWSSYLQRHLTSPAVVVSKLHPIMGLRVAALFLNLTKQDLASDTPGRGTFQILSGVRTKAQQTALYNDICLRQRRCAYVANPTSMHAVDGEGVARQGSNHQAQLQSWGPNAIPAGNEVGYAIDLRNNAGSSTEAWKPVHDRLATFGLDWPLKTGAIERWHIEWFPRSSGVPLNGSIAWPTRPGIHRPLKRGHIGGDVAALQRQLGILVDDRFGAGTENAVSEAEADLGLSVNGVWTASNQRKWEKAQLPPAPVEPDPSPAPVEPDPPRFVIPPTDAALAMLLAAKNDLDEAHDLLGSGINGVDRAIEILGGST